MKKCYKCSVDIHSSVARCPLCKSSIEDDGIDESVFPLVPNIYIKHKLIFKCIIFLSIIGSVISLMINYLISDRISWAWFVVAGIVSFWATFITGIKRRNNIMNLLFVEIFVVLISAIAWDYFTGWHFWSITFVLPFICIAYITTLFFLRIFLKNIFKDHIIYIYINSIVGLIPLYFLLRHSLKIKWPSILCVCFSIFSIIALGVFNHKQMKAELERRLHI